MLIVPFEAEHLKDITLQPEQVYLRTYLTDEMMEQLESDNSFTVIVNNRPIGCGGVIPVWENRAYAWAYLSNDAASHMVAITRAVKRFFNLFPCNRIEATVDAGFEDAHRWIKMLGFKMEAPVMKCYRPDGGDSSLYARVKCRE